MRSRCPNRWICKRFQKAHQYSMRLLLQSGHLIVPGVHDGTVMRLV